MSAEPVVTDNPDRQRYEIHVGDELGGYVQYRRQGNVVDLIHTEIDPKFEGHGLGSVLAKATLDDLDRRGLGYVATCPFISAYLERHPRQAQ